MRKHRTAWLVLVCLSWLFACGASSNLAAQSLAGWYVMNRTATLAGPFATSRACARVQARTKGATGCEYQNEPEARPPIRFVSPGAAAGEAISKYYDDLANRRLIEAETEALRATLPPVQPGPPRIYVEGGPKRMKEAVLAVLRSGFTDHGLMPVPYSRNPEANITLQKSGGAKVKCGQVKAFLPGPTAEEIVEQFRVWLPGPLALRRAEHR